LTFFSKGNILFYACNDEAVYKAHAGLNIKGLRIIVICRQRLLRSGERLIFQDRPHYLLIKDNVMKKEDKKIEILITYFKILREEILERLKLISRIELGKFVIVFSGLALAISKDFHGDMEKVAVFGFLPLLSLLFDFYIAHNHSMIHKIGSYIHNHIEKEIKKETALKKIVLWEHYVSKSNQKRWDIVGRIVHLGTSFGVVVVSGSFYYEAVQKWSCNGYNWLIALYVIVYFIFLIFDFFILGINKKWKEYYV
jgi:hypothetical protein